MATVENYTWNKRPSLILPDKLGSFWDLIYYSSDVLSDISWMTDSILYMKFYLFPTEIRLFVDTVCGVN